MMERFIALDASGRPVLVQGTPNGDLEATPWEDAADMPWESTCLGIQSITLDAPDQVEYKSRHDVRARPYLTILRPSDATWMLDKLRPIVEGKTVVEIGAGIGVLAVALAGIAARVWAIEADPMWGFVFCRWLYRAKPTNLTYVIDSADHLADTIRADIAVIVTGSDEARLFELGRKFAPVVVMPWQDWRDGRAVANSWRGL